ncbi:hypothetical protein [uncultured Imperialibacter sp.]|uniref:hypothetical protein n=1 Tax=uncultured Imperialibacter sp. TaxID=1672639 RepID=UPI0030DC9B7B|tara:strand:+ start:601 stop:1809 length:1209 start_codon:yes stop_codon:yes gene_type:complete
MKKYQLTIVFLGLIFMQGYGQGRGEDLLPEIEIGFKTITTGNYFSNKGIPSLNIPVLNEGERTVSDFSDSYFMIGARQKLYKGWRGQMVLGFSFPDANTGLGQVFYNQIMARVENKKNIITIGRTTTQTTLGSFTTFRDDDVMQFNYILNPFSSGINTEDNQYANVLEYTRIFKNRLYVTLHGENYQSFSNPNDYSLNGIGGSIVYRVPESQVWKREIIKEIGVSSVNFDIENPNSPGSNTYLSNLASYVGLNIHPDPVHFVDFKLMNITNFGMDGISDITSYDDYTRSKSQSFFGMVRYLNRKLERPNYQISLGGGYKSLSEINGGANQYVLITNMFYRIGNNFDFLVQYRYHVNRGELIPLLGKSQHRFQVGLSFSFNKIFNNQFDDRNSILNLEHGYIK